MFALGFLYLVLVQLSRIATSLEEARDVFRDMDARIGSEIDRRRQLMSMTAGARRA